VIGLPVLAALFQSCPLTQCGRIPSWLLQATEVILMRYTKIPFDQNLYLKKGDPGACNALVLEWLYNRGMPLRQLKRTTKRAVAVHNRKVAYATFKDYGLEITDADIFAGQNLYQIDQCINRIRFWKEKELFIGFSNPTSSVSGHAIGLISRGSGAVGFDPNNGYYIMEFQEGDALDEYDWLKKKMLGASLKHSYSQFLVYGCSRKGFLDLFGEEL
jgi:hypothetical protein